MSCCSAADAPPASRERIRAFQLLMHWFELEKLVNVEESPLRGKINIPTCFWFLVWLRTDLMEPRSKTNAVSSNWKPFATSLQWYSSNVQRMTSSCTCTSSNVYAAWTHVMCSSRNISCRRTAYIASLDTIYVFNVKYKVYDDCLYGQPGHTLCIYH